MAKNLFIGLCMAVIAVSLGFSLWVHTFISLPEAIAVASGLFSLQAAGYLLVSTAGSQRAMKTELEERRNAEGANRERIEQLTDSLANVSNQLSTVARIEMEPLISELEVIGTLVKDIAETSVGFDERIEKVEENLKRTRSAIKSQSSTGQSETAGGADQREEAGTQMGVSTSPDMASQEPGSETAPLDPTILRALDIALDRNQVDIYLQPIVTIPHRKPKFYEAVSRLRLDSGELIKPSQFMRTAEQTGKAPVLDKMFLIRAIQVLRRLMDRKSDAVLICNISAASLADVVFFDDFRKLLRAKSEIADHLIFEFSHPLIKDIGPIEEESLRALKSMGFMFALNGVTDLSMDYRKLNALGFHFAKVPLPLLVKARETGINDIHAEDFALYLARNGIQLIVEQIDSEAEVIELLNFEVSLAQGLLFGAPREVKADPAQSLRRQQDRLAG